MNWEQTELAALPQAIWAALARACTELDHPFRTAVLGTNRGEGGALRTVILRHALEAGRVLSCYTDYRTPKVIQIARCPAVAWLFYDPHTRVQIRAAGRAAVQHQNPTTLIAWRELPVSSRMLYCSESPPGTEVQKPEQAWPGFVQQRNPTVEAVEIGYERFAVVETIVEELDFLQLDWTVQRRALFEWGQGGFVGRWTVP